jgi:hypothetical protein
MRPTTQCAKYGRFTSALPRLRSRQRESKIANLSQRARNRCSVPGVPSAPTAVYTKSQAALYLRVAEASAFPRKDFMNNQPSSQALAFAALEAALMI